MWLFYERMLGFRVFGSTRADPRVQAPATLLHLDLRHAETQIAKFGGGPSLQRKSALFTRSFCRRTRRSVSSGTCVGLPELLFAS